MSRLLIGCLRQYIWPQRQREPLARARVRRTHTKNKIKRKKATQRQMRSNQRDEATHCSVDLTLRPQSDVHDWIILRLVFLASILNHTSLTRRIILQLFFVFYCLRFFLRIDCYIQRWRSIILAINHVEFWRHPRSVEFL